MSIRDAIGDIEDKIPVKTVLVSVFDKSGLDTLVHGLMKSNEDVQFLSSTGTYKKIKEILESDEYPAIAPTNNLREISEYTGFPEMDGGLVKTLHPMVFGGILGERNNHKHQKYFFDNGGKYIDMVVVNLYPFNQVIKQPDVTLEKARSNIDIGGPSMLRAAAKNFLGCAAVCESSSYERLLKHIEDNNGCTTLDMRFDLAERVFGMTNEYDRDIQVFMQRQKPGQDVNSEISNAYNGT